MLVLGRSRGEKIEIESCALIHVARIEESRVRLDVIAPFSQVLPAEQAKDAALERIATVTVLGIRRKNGSDILRASIGIRVPGGGTVHRAEVARQLIPAHRRFPWHRFRTTARIWRQVNEQILIPQPES